MRCFIKDFIYYGGFDQLYQHETWDFTGRIKYQGNESGEMIVSFEVTMMDHKDEPLWYTSFFFDFDDSTNAVIFDCNDKK